MSMIRVEHLSRDYGGGKGVFDVSFSIRQGETFGFLGPNGAGKTTTIRHLMGFLRPQSGKCFINDMDCWDNRDRIQSDLGYVPGEISFFDDMTGTEYLSFMEKYRRIGSDSRKKELLDFFELDPACRIKKMSKGMKQKLGLVSAMMHDPQILIFDEPTSGLDPLMQSKFVELVNHEREQGKTILMSSHMFEEVERTCDHVGIIRSGRMIAVETVEALRERHVRAYTVTLSDPATARAFAKDFGGKQDDCRVTVSTRQSLEDIFMSYYGGEKDA